MLFRDSLCDGESQAVMLPLVGPRFVRAVETVKEMRLLFRWDLLSFVHDFEDCFVPFTPQREPDLFSCRMPYGVVQKD